MKTGLNSVDAVMRSRVQQALRDIEKRHDVRVLYACESGSRGWGFASPDSDYDVRFLYVHPPEWYLRVEPQRDVIELPIDSELDVCGWEWRKALGLLKSANPTLQEWLHSPLVYEQDNECMDALRAQVPDWFSAQRARWHYFSMARKNFRGYLQEDEVRLKKYFYVLRPLLAVQWLEAGKGFPPVRFDQLMEGTVTDPLLLEEIHQLLEVKQNAGEAKYGPRRPRIHEFILQELNTDKDRMLLPESRMQGTAALDALLFKTVMV
ncbi:MULTISPECIES: nucleotidyltransferase domain-containing protein [Buttiauxella]|uniref:Nucleotidyltransferase n=1 Tax=Buttiauxella ferragutiae ATCC 51602 TaxID=1354252 RepID=A0ABX2WDI0_9ENTR|nr:MULTISPECIES: nucleotidyltransferase domain-containing protein [Buttiauxella]AYN28123.1 nucleotidyltransferase domain-containing protein [Buttiauxella sp. 3AFRM03]OAT31033.1 putative nucleotidyltransferase [Buttiauxella ferragutiae ATCC 51602]UNK61259.1 nucleotidyltransferase domain-containing protein [Buttiauxella ferragutiae]